MSPASVVKGAHKTPSHLFVRAPEIVEANNYMYIYVYIIYTYSFLVTLIQLWYHMPQANYESDSGFTS